MSNLVLGGGGAAASGYDIDQSLRFDDGDSAYLSRTPSSAGNLRTWTWSGWVKRGNLTVWQVPFSAGRSSPEDRTEISFESADTIRIFQKDGGSTAMSLVTTQVFRDSSAWYHLVVAMDTTQATDTNRVKLYVNGSQVTVFGTTTYPTQNLDTWVNSTAVPTTIGTDSRLYSADFDGYLAEVHFIDGTALGPESFGETDAATNQWKPINVTGLTYGTNGFYQKYSSTELADSFTDSSSRTVTANGNVHTDTSVKKFGTASAQFDGTGDSLTMSDYSDWSFGTGDFTLETWVRFNDSAGNENLFNQYQGASNRWYLSADLTNNTLAFYDAGSGMDVEQTVGTFAADTWYHIAMVRTSGVVAYYMAGTRYTVTGTSPGGDITSNTGSLEIGEYNGGDALNGYLDEIRISDTARYSGATISVPTEAFTTDSNTLLLLHCDGSDSGTTFTDSSTRPRHTITAVGDVANTRAQYKVGDSSIKFDGTGDYLSLTSSAGNDLIGGSGSWTIEGWVRWTSGSSIFMEQGDSVTRALQFWIQPDGDIQIYLSNTDGSWDFNNISGSTLTADTWTHLALVKNSSAITLYKDGVTDSVIDGSTTQTSINNSSGTFYIGSYNAASSFWNGYMDEIRISDSARYTTDFDPVPTTAFVADANTKLLIHSDFNGGLGADSSGNKNDFAVTNLVATDQMIDTPTNNYCTLNPLFRYSSDTASWSEGNLKHTASGASEFTTGTFSVNSGKWYYEMAGITDAQTTIGAWKEEGLTYTTTTFTSLWNYRYYGSNGIVYDDNGTTIQTYSTYAPGDVIGCALDMDNGAIYFSKNGVWQGSSNPATGSNPAATTNLTDGKAWVPAGTVDSSQSAVFNFGQDSSFAGNETAQGNGGDGEDFYYTPPTGYVALNTDNLSDPAIALPTDHFDTKLWQGTSAIQSITGLSFEPDFLWIKARTVAYQHSLRDSIRGSTKTLRSNMTTAEETQASSVTSFNSDGWSMGADTSAMVNYSTSTYVGWAWKGGGAASAIAVGSIDGTNPTIASSVSANTTAGFSIVSYTGTGSAATIGHGLAQAPDMVICKERSAVQQWINYQSPLGATKYLHLNGTDAAVTNSTVWNDEEPTPSVFSVGTAVNCNESSGTYIAYCFHSIEGYSKVGTYVGNGVVDGTFVYLGFKPAFLFWKQSSAARDWAIIDSSRSVYNDQAQSLFPNDDAAEYDGAAYGIDLVSNGFKWRSSNSTTNISSGTYIYYAVAESPFKTSNAR